MSGASIRDRSAAGTPARLVLTLAAVMAGATAPAAAQPYLGGLGGDRFGSVLALGPGSTIEGDVSRGYGVYYAGLGQFNLDTARANAINTATAVSLNEYIYQSRMAMRRRYAEKVEGERRRNQQRREARATRIDTMPTEQDIMSGDALNRIAEDLAGYRVTPSMLRTEAEPLPVEVIQSIPYMYPSVGGIISLRRMLPDDVDWPIALRGQAAESRRVIYDGVVQEALLKSQQGQLTLDDIRAIQAAIRDLRSVVPPTASGTEQTAFYQAQVFLNQLEATARTLQASATSVAIAELDGFHGTTVFHLIDFMERFNLTFAAARTPEERAIYNELYHVLARQRNDLNDQLGPAEDAIVIDQFRRAPEGPR